MTALPGTREAMLRNEIYEYPLLGTNLTCRLANFATSGITAFPTMKKVKSSPHTLAELSLGEYAIIDSFTDKEISIKLLEMGCLPGEVVQLTNIAPFGDPIAISVSGYTLGLRKAEASSVIIRHTPLP